jgi:protocatechuate 3,4-dioxygenase beta subunit
MLSLKANLYIVAMFLIFSVGYASSQTMTSGTVIGTVTDSTGAAIPGATVTITQSSTGTVRTTKTNESGQYRFPFLMPSEYVVSAEATGQRTNGTRFTLLVGQEQPVNIVMKVQSLSQTVEVNASAVLLQTENANEDTYIGQKEVSNMPINGGDITNNLNNKSGASNNTLGANDIAEAAVIVDAFSAQYGREAGAQVNYITKSGTNRVHGNLVENYNDAIMNANAILITRQELPVAVPSQISMPHRLAVLF